MKSINNTYTAKNEDGTVTLYIDTLSQDIVDIDVAPGETYVKFETERVNIRNSAYSTRVWLRNILKQFPDVTTIEIGSGVYELDINNEMFPNVRHVISKNSNFANGKSMLLKKIHSGLKLCNSFCLKENEVLDLSGVTVLDAYSLSGCMSDKIVNESKVNYIDMNAFVGSIFTLKNTGSSVAMAGTMLVDVNAGFDETDFPKEISVVRNNIDLLKVKNARFPSLKVFDVFRGHTDLSFGKLCFSGDDSFELSALMSRNECGCFNNVEEFDINNQYYKTIDGIIYSNDGKTLIACPGKKGGTIKVAEGTKYVLRCAFYNSHASEIIFPDSLIELGPESIKACDNLQHIDFGKGIKRIGGADMPTISYCENLAKFDIPEQVEAIGINTFYCLKGLTTVHFHDGIKRIERYAFASCDKLNDITLPESVTNIGQFAFGAAENVHLQGHCMPRGLVKSVAQNSTAVYAPTEDMRAEMLRSVVTVEVNGTVVYIPKYMTTETINRTDDRFNTYGLTDEFYMFIYEMASCTNARQDIAAKIYKLTKNEEVGSYLRRISNSYSSRLLKEGREEDLVEFLKLGLMTENAIKKLLKKADEKEAAIVSAYILRLIDNTSITKTSFKL